MGSKRRIAGDILPVIVRYMEGCDGYIEPFCGSCSIAMRLPEFLPCGHRVERMCCDVNPYLIEMFKYFTENHNAIEKVIEGGRVFSSFPPDEYFIEKDVYKGWRDFFYSTMYDHILYSQENIALCGFVGYMASFHGRLYDGGYGGKAGKRNYVDEHVRNFLKDLPALAGIDEFVFAGYGLLSHLMDKTKKYLIYCDIPYRNTKQYMYSRDFDYDSFYEWCSIQRSLGHTVIVSEYEMPADRFELIFSKKIKNSMNLEATHDAEEKLFLAVA